MNNFRKTIELLDEIEEKLKSKSELGQVVIDQLASVSAILNEDLENMIKGLILFLFKMLLYIIQIRLNQVILFYKIIPQNIKSPLRLHANSYKQKYTNEILI